MDYLPNPKWCAYQSTVRSPPPGRLQPDADIGLKLTALCVAMTGPAPLGPAILNERADLKVLALVDVLYRHRANRHCGSQR